MNKGIIDTYIRLKVNFCLTLSEKESTIGDDTKNLLLKYLLVSFKADEFFSFTHSYQVLLNELYAVINELFLDKKSFVRLSQNIAKLLYEHSSHPKVKEGKLNIVIFSNVAFDDEIVEAIGIFKSEKDTPYIRMLRNQSNYNIEHEHGFDIKGIDKGCLILNTNNDAGYKLLVIDNANKAIEAQYWKDNFLKVKPISNEYFQTNQFLKITKDYITKELSKEFDIPKTDQIDLLNRSIIFF